MSFKKSFVRNVVISGGYNYFSQAIAFFSSIIVSRLLMPSSYGLVSIITVFTGFLSIFADSGISLAIIRSEFGNTYHKSVDTLALYIGIFLCALTSLLAYPIGIFFRQPELMLPMIFMSFGFILKSLTLVRGALLMKQMNFGFIGFASLMANVSGVCMTVVLAFMGAGYWSLVIPQTLAGIVVLVLQERKLKFGFNLYSWAHVKVAGQYTKRTIGNLIGFNMINYWSRNLDNLMVGRLFGAAQLGIYNRGYNLLTYPLSLITGIIGTVLYPSLNQLKNSEKAVKGEYLFILRLIGFVTFPVAVILLMFPASVVSILWGSKWAGVAKFVPYFGLLVLSQSLLSTVGNILVLMKREEILRISGWVSAAAVIIGITYGAFISPLAVAQYYSLSFILIVLPFNMMYVYIRTLHFSARSMLFFWMPNILFSLAIWATCFYDLPKLRIVALSLFFISMVMNASSEIKKIVVFLNNNSWTYDKKRIRSI